MLDLARFRRYHQVRTAKGAKTRCGTCASNTTQSGSFFQNAPATSSGLRHPSGSLFPTTAYNGRLYQPNRPLQNQGL